MREIVTRHRCGRAGFAARRSYRDQKREVIMSQGLTAKAEVTIHAPVDKVWDALVNPEAIKRYMFGATVDSDWKEGSPITWKGEWKGKAFEDKGRVVEVRRGERLRYTHYSPLTGAPDVPESYHNVTVSLSARNGDVRVELSQDQNKTEKAREESQRNWEMMLQGLKKVAEG
jgi:uncharacterized protein YndB with AHSA1/START domain